MSGSDGHGAAERAERMWIALSGALVALFVGLVFHAVTSQGHHIGHTPARQAPAQILARPEFANPGVHRDQQGRLRATLVAQAFSFAPSQIEVPVGEEIIFRITSRDVIHGMQVLGTAVNVELIPGELVEFRYTFRRAGEYPIVCNQYCGLAHQNMVARILAIDGEGEAAGSPALVEATGADQEAAAGAQAAPFLAGEAVYRSQCLACHQEDGSGMPGVFPPLNAHLPRVAETDGGRDYLIDVMLYGLAGEIVVDGATYRGMMPGLPRLADEEIADVLNYSLHAWGNAQRLSADERPFDAEDIAARRGLDRSLEDVRRTREQLHLH